MAETEGLLESELLKFWQLIKIEPEKWQEEEFGEQGGGLWVVGIAGKRVIWYNDIEEGFNLSNYSKYGEIEGYMCEQLELSYIVWQLYHLAKIYVISLESPKSLTTIRLTKFLKLRKSCTPA
jgi:hypothetical protein